MKKPNLLVLGASGGVAKTFLHHLTHHRNILENVVLLDPNKEVCVDPYIDHRALKYSFLKRKITVPEKEQDYVRLLKEQNIDIVLDLTDADSIPLLEATNKAGVSYLNTSLNTETMTTFEIVSDIYKRRKTINKAPHILCAGMNPGIVNMWVRLGIEQYGVPKEIVHFEYDTSQISGKHRSLITWSIHEFLMEAVLWPAGLMRGKDKVKYFYPNALENRVALKPVLQPLFPLKKYPEGFLVLHEENVSIAQKYNIPSQFVYAINMETTKNLLALYKQNKKVDTKDLVLGDNTTRVLEGADSIGVLLEYPEKKVYYFNTLPNVAFIGSNATYTQVVIGVFAALFTLVFDKLKNGVYFVEDLGETHFKYYAFDNMRVQHFVFKKQKGHLALEKYVPEIKFKRNHHLQHVYL